MGKIKLYFRDEKNFSMGRLFMGYVFVCVFVGLLLGASANFAGESIESVEASFIERIQNPEDGRCSVFEPTCKDMKLWVWGLSVMVMGGMTAIVFLFVPLGYAMPFIIYFGPIIPLVFVAWLYDYMFALGLTGKTIKHLKLIFKDKTKGDEK